MAEWKPSNVDRALSIMFPGPDTASTSAPRRLLQTWDNQVTEEINEKYKNGSEVPNDGRAVQWLCDRLTKYDSVKPHLLLVSAHANNIQPLSLLAKEPCSLPFNFSRFLAFPLSLPNPGPLMMRAMQIAEEACFATNMVTEKGVCSFYSRTASLVCHSDATCFRIRSFRYAKGTYVRIGNGDATRYDSTGGRKLIAAHFPNAWSV